MRLLVFISGRGNSIFRSILPGRSNAGSRLSILLVASMTFTSALASKPSNWFSSSNMVLWISRSPPEWASYLQNRAINKTEIYLLFYFYMLHRHTIFREKMLGKWYGHIASKKQRKYQKINIKIINSFQHIGKCSDTYLFVPTASISSMKTIDGESSSATLNSSRTSLGPSPKYFWINSLPTTRRNVAEVEFATA